MKFLQATKIVILMENGKWKMENFSGVLKF